MLLLLLLRLLPQFLVLCVADEQISVKVNESGWAWMVCGERLIIWKICQTAVAKVSHHHPETITRSYSKNTKQLSFFLPFFLAVVCV